MSITGLPGQGPVRVSIPIADLCAGLFAAQGVMIALLEREQSGKGQWVQSSLQPRVFMLISGGTLDGRSGSGATSRQQPSDSIPTGVFETSDGHINIASEQAIYERFCKAVDAEHLITNPSTRTEPRGRRNRMRMQRSTRLSVLLLKPGQSPERSRRAVRSDHSIDEVFVDPQIKPLARRDPCTRPTRTKTSI